MLPKRIAFFFGALSLHLHAEPLPEGSYVDFVVIPAGPVRLAEFEADTESTQNTRDGQKQEQPRGVPAGGSGVKVKETDPAEVPPTAVYIRKDAEKCYQIPCFLNAIGVPVRTPVTDTEITFLTKTGDTLAPLEKQTLPANATRVLVILNKPLNEKRWTKPAVTMIPIPAPEEGMVLVANASPATACGLVCGDDRKILLQAMKHFSWRQTAGPERTMIAMTGTDGKFRPPFFDEYLKDEKSATTLVVAFEVTPQESFRCGKYAVGAIHAQDFRPAVVSAERSR